MRRTSLGGVAKKRTASCPLFEGRGVALADLGDLTDPGQFNGQGPVLFIRQSVALAVPGQFNGQGPVLFIGQSVAHSVF